MKIYLADMNRGEVHNLLGGAIAPLPITLISTIGEDSIYNAAPYSFVSPVNIKPPVICVAISVFYGAAFPAREGQRKDTLKNIEFSGDFVVNIMAESLIDPTVQTSAAYPADVNEIQQVGLTAIGGEKVKSPRIAEAQVSFECRLVQKIELGEGQDSRGIVFGEVVLAHVKDGLWVDGKIESSKLKAVGRLGTGLYCRTGDIFEVKATPI